MTKTVDADSPPAGQSVRELTLSKALSREDFPLSSKFDPEWVIQNQMGPNALWLTEWLCDEMDLKPGMRVLDMGCGKAMSSILLARDFGVQVWANDLWVDPTENWQRICALGLENQVFPIHAEAHALPYAHGFFDAIVSLDAYHYFGTEDLYIGEFSKLVKPGHQIGIVVPGVMQELKGQVPEHLKKLMPEDRMDQLFSFHSPAWWRSHWDRNKNITVEIADSMEGGWKIWRDFNQVQIDVAKPDAPWLNNCLNLAEVLKTDQGQFLGFVRVVARREN